MDHTNRNPLRKITRESETVDIVRGDKRRRLHKAFLRYHDANNWPLLREALKAMGRADLIGNGKHRLAWHGPVGYMAKDKVKLLLNLVASAVTVLPRGGDIEVGITGSLEVPSFVLRCRGTGARPPQYLTEFVAASQPPQLDAMTIQAYYTWRLAGTSGMRIEILKDGADILLVARPAA